MIAVLSQMALLIACGSAWQKLAPRHIPAIAHRRALTDLVFYILLPALVIDVIWAAELDNASLRISLVAMTGLLSSAVFMWVVLRFLPVSAPQKGALILAGVFPNVTYLGLPVLDQALGSWSNAIVLQYDLFACTPILMTLGILMSQYYGQAQTTDFNPLKTLLKIPPLWAVVIAVLLNILNVPQPELIHDVLTVLSAGVVPLMLIALGMSIRWQSLRWQALPILLPVVISTLFIAPLAVWGMTHFIVMPEQIAFAVILAAAMPTMVFGIVICERFELDTSLYAAAVTLTTVLCLISLPLWFHLLA